MRKYVCPKCKKKAGVNIMYGEPEPVDEEEQGEVVLGGCCIVSDGEYGSPDRKCLDCGHEWLIRRRDKGWPTKVINLEDLTYLDDSKIGEYDTENEEFEELYTTGMKPSEFAKPEEGKAYKAWVEKNKERLVNDYGDMDVLSAAK
jgi:DNA-directed RNA polymerase subunit RPC12/RpoP